MISRVGRSPLAHAPPFAERGRGSGGGGLTCVLVLTLLACETPITIDASTDGCAPITITQSGTYDASCGAELALEGAHIVELWSDDELTFDGEPTRYLGPIVIEGVHMLEGTTIHLRDHGPPIDDVAIDRSLTWTHAALLDDPSAAGLARVMRTVSDDPGPALAAWFDRFATTAHSERAGPQRLLQDFAVAHGDDPRAWDLDALPFRVTGVHNRIDLRDGSHCGELRVSLASTDPLHQPFHLIFLYRQPATEEDRAPDGTAHCIATSLRWARLSALDEPAFVDAARVWLDETLARDRLIAVESLEFLISPWEWRQWFMEGGALENRPLFQTVDTPRLNRQGPDRAAFLAWIEDNAAEIDARRALIPEQFRSPSARVNDGVPWIPLDLTGLDPSVAAAYPTIRQQIELVGCPACHATDADFVQTLPDRSFSPFYAKELEARADRLLELGAAAPPFGPLQPSPALPP
jgi:hypothetical protein